MPLEVYIFGAIVLIMLAVCINLLTKLTSKPGAAGSAVVPQAATFSGSPKAQGGLELIAVISAAVSAMLEEEGEDSGAFRIRSISPVRQNGRAAWGFAGVAHNTRPF